MLSTETELQSSRIGSFRESCREGVYPFVCCAVVLLCVLIANPFSGAGFIDDWSYSHLALKFAQTGQVQYDGWGSPTLLFQCLWAAGWIRLLGFSFDLMRAITLPFALGFVLLIYATGRRIGLRRDLSLFGALTVGTAPLFLPLAASFMTDVYGCFFCALCIYAAISGVETRSTRVAAFWVWVLAVSGILGGSDRQIVWVAPLTLVPYLFWAKRFDRRFSLHAAAAYVLCLVALVSITVKFVPPYAPFALHNHQIARIMIDNGPFASAMLLGLLLACLLMSLPVLLCFVPCWRVMGSGRVLVVALVSVAATLLMAAGLGQFGAAPFMIGILSQFGILINGWDSLGFKPVVLQPWLRICITVFVIFSGIAFCLLRSKTAKFPRAPLAIFTIFSFGYITLLLPAMIFSLVFDRYILPLLPVVVLLLLHQFQHRARRVPAIAWTCLIVFAAYGMVITHDYGSAGRARVRAAQLLQEHGIPRGKISAGFEYDAWTQLDTAGTIVGTTYRDSFDWNRTDRFWFWHFTTALHPEYVVSSSRVAGKPNALVNVPFTTWLPPFHRFALAQRRGDLSKGPVCNTLRPCSLP